MSLSLYNSLTKREEEFAPLKRGKVGMYTCGPTVYDRPHIGNYSSFLMADLLRRWLEVSGYQVTQVKNITDVGHLVADGDEGEDKIERQAREEKLDPLAIAHKYTEQYLADEEALNMIEPEHRPRATETIPEMIEIVKGVLQKEIAYETEDGIYFDVHKFPQYGALSGNTLDKLEAGARIEINERKRHPADFALWKKCVGANARHVLRWKFSTGEMVKTEGEDTTSGFPGWHIECSAMSRKFLGETFDLHTGGEDNIFPHHESEIAQSESFTGKPFVRYWLHKRRIEIVARDEGRKESGQSKAKMSKSLGNVITLDDVTTKGFSPLDLRYLLLSVHYRTRLKFSWKGMEDSEIARRTILDWMRRGGAGECAPVGKPGAEIPMAKEKDIQKFIDEFETAMNDDLNTSSALAVVFEAIHLMNRSGMPEPATEPKLRMLIDKVRRTFGCFDDVHVEAEISADVQSLFSEREQARRKKDFKKADELRTKILERGFRVDDTPQGSRVVKI